MNTLDDSSKFLLNTAQELRIAKDIDPNEMYRILIEFGKKLDVFPESEKIEKNKVKGCTSNVYISSNKESDRLFYKGTSDAMIVKGYLSILIEALSGLKQDEIKKSEDLIKEFIEVAQVRSSLTPSRANAFGSIYTMMLDKAKE